MLSEPSPKVPRLKPCVAIVMLAFLLLPAGADASIPGPQLLTFGDYATGTEVST